MRNMSRLQHLLVSTFVILGALQFVSFFISLIADTYAYGSKTQQYSNISYGGITVVFLLSLISAVFGYLALLWLENKDRKIYEVPTSDNYKYYMEYPTDKQFNLLMLGEKEVSGISTGRPSSESPRVSRIPVSLPDNLSTQIPIPTPQEVPDSLTVYLRQNGGA